MSEIRVNTIVAAEGTSAPRLPYGVSVPTGMGLTGAGGINITGVVTAANIAGNVTGLINSAGVSTIARLEVTKDINVGAAVTVAGISKFTDTTDSTSSTTGGVIVTGGLGVAKNVYIGAGLSVAGTLTYQDVTEVDSVGLITAQSGVNVSGGQLVVGAGFSVGAAGVGTFAGNLVVNGDIDLAGSIDVDGTCEADAYTVAGTALDTHIAGVTVTNATHILVTDNESTNESNLITFVENATSSTGQVGLEMDGNLTYNPSTGNLSATQLTGTLQTAAQTNITSVGTLGGLTVTGDVSLDNGSDAGKDILWDVSEDSLVFEDSVYLKLGSGGDLKIYHDGSNSYIDEVGTGDLYIRSNSDTRIKIDDAGAVTLNYETNGRLITTNDGVNVTGMTTVTTGAHFQGMLREDCNIVANKISAATDIDLEDGMVHYFTTNETGTSTPNIRWNSSYSLNNKMSTGEIVTITIITKPNGAGYQASLNVDGSGVTEEWLGGAAPSSANASGYDVMTHSLIKTGSGAFLCLSNVQNYA